MKPVYPFETKKPCHLCDRDDCDELCGTIMAVPAPKVFAYALQHKDGTFWGHTSEDNGEFGYSLYKATLFRFTPNEEEFLKKTLEEGFPNAHVICVGLVPIEEEA